MNAASACSVKNNFRVFVLFKSVCKRWNHCLWSLDYPYSNHRLLHCYIYSCLFSVHSFYFLVEYDDDVYCLTSLVPPLILSLSLFLVDRYIDIFRIDSKIYFFVRVAGIRKRAQRRERPGGGISHDSHAPIGLCLEKLALKAGKKQNTIRRESKWFFGSSFETPAPTHSYSDSHHTKLKAKDCAMKLWNKSGWEG